MATLKGKSALITGSNGGIGHAMAAAFADQGCNIALNGPGTPDEMEKLRAAIAVKGVKCIYSPADVGKPAEIEQMMGKAADEFGSVDILINNAAIRHFHPIDEFPVAEWDSALAVNLSAAFHTIRLALPGMKKRNWGRIINMGSVYSVRGHANRVDYVTAKHAIIGLTKTVALEVAKTGITCNAFQPGWVLTPHSERQIAAHMDKTGSSREEAIDALVQLRQPSRRIITMDQVAAFALFLCSDAASNITGSALSIDGGWTAAG
jgi:3-hydroxybutyrate dehydrogenase